MNAFIQLLIFLFLPMNLFSVDIALTIDDHPMVDGSLFSTKKRTTAIIAALEKHSCKAAFFCLGSHCLDKKRSDLLSDIDTRGHFLCNHSMNHHHLSSQSLDSFKKEIEEVDKLLKPYQNMRRWYRYPYLDYGTRASLGGSQEKRIQSLQILKELDYTEGYVSIDTLDWHINVRLSQALKKGQHVDYKTLEKLYLQLLKSWCQHYVNLYANKLQKKITHTLILHANDLNALFLEKIIDMIKESGWNIVSPEQAFSDISWWEDFTNNPKFLDKKPSTLDIPEIDKLLDKENVFIE